MVIGGCGLQGWADSEAQGRERGGEGEGMEGDSEGGRETDQCPLPEIPQIYLPRQRQGLSVLYCHLGYLVKEEH